MAGLSQIYADGFARDLIPRSTAPTFLSSTSYAVGDYVYYQGNLYRCTTAHTGTWVASHFTAVTIGSELKAKEAEIADVKSDLNPYKDIPVVANGSFSTSGLTTGVGNRIRTDLIQFTSGCTIEITNGTGFRHSCGMWEGSVSSANIKRNDSQWNTSNETVTTTFDGYMVVVFSKTDNSNVTPSQFTGNIKGYISQVSKNTVAIEEIKESTTANLIDPIFYNGSTSSGAISYANPSCRQWVVTPEIMKVKKGSYITKKNTAMYVGIVRYADDGSFMSNIYADTLPTTYTFSEDMNVRIVARATDYAFIIPDTIKNNYDFYLVTDKAVESKTKVLFIGLGVGSGYPSGQSQLVQLPNGKNLLIDSHLTTNYTSFYNMLRTHGVRRIDYYVQSHYHGDHFGIYNLLTQSSMANNIDISGATVFLPQKITVESLAHITGDTPSTLVERQDQLETLLTEKGCTIIRPTEKQTVEVADGITLEFYNTDHSIYSDSESGYYSTNYNDWSLCCNLIFGLNTINFSADLGPIAERKVGGTLRKADILTAPHHGWDNGANNLIPSFINNVNPNVVISVNGWEHNPANENSSANMMLSTSAMQSFCEANAVSNYPTCLNGAIGIEMNKYGWMFDGIYSRYIRNGKNWKYNDNTDKVES